MPKQYPSKIRYDAENTRKYSLKLNRKTDADLIDYLESQPSIQAAIKEALREKIARSRSK